MVIHLGNLATSPKVLISLAIGGSGSLCLIFKMFTDIGFEWAIAVRVVQGAFQGCFAPGQDRLMVKMAPVSGANIADGIISTFSLAGSVISSVLTAFLCQRYGWYFTFCLFGFISVIWTAFWLLFHDLSLVDHLSRPSEEVELLRNESEEHRHPHLSRAAVYWKCRTFWIACVLHLCSGLLANVILVCVPKFFFQVFGFSLVANGILSATPFCAQLPASLIVLFILGTA